MKRSFQGLGVLVLGAVALSAVAETVPFIETFDDRDTGVLHNQHGWQARKQNDARVQTTTKFAGAKAGLVETNSIVWNTFTNSNATNVWIDFYGRMSYPTNDTAPALTGSVTAAFFVGTTGQIWAVSNDTWVTLNHTIPSNTWRRFSVHLDYGNSRWELHVAGDEPNTLSTPVATNLVFSASSTNEYFKTFRVKN
ncbi:MAG: hypothetical protein HQ559_03400 [Lentisphaerae bacterium]|nr:hypothetical protein [Lentisphaerota bacterium]